MELRLPEEKPQRDKKGRLLKGHKGLWTGKKWDDYVPKETQIKMLQNLKKTKPQLNENLMKAVVAIKDGKLCGVFKSAKIAYEKTNIYYGSIRKCCKKVVKTAGGYQWFYETDNEWTKLINQ